MTAPIPNAALLDPPPMSPARFASIERDVTRLLGTERDVVLLQAEAILALEETGRGDQLTLRRLKKQKLLLKDRIQRYEDLLTPDIIA